MRFSKLRLQFQHHKEKKRRRGEGKKQEDEEEEKPMFFSSDMTTYIYNISLMAVPFEVNGQAGRGEGRYSGGETHHSASGSVLQSKIHMRR